MQLRQIAANEALHQPHEVVDLTGRARPVLRGKTVDREVLDAELHGRAHRAAYRFHAAPVSLRTRQATLGGPTPVAIHDDGDVARHLRTRLPDRSFVLLVHRSGIMPSIAWPTACSSQLDWAAAGRAPRSPHPSYLLDLGFFASQRLIDLLDELVGQILYLAGILVMVVLAHLSVLVEALEQLHAVAAHVAHRDPRMLGIFMRDLDEFLAPLGRERGNGQPDQRPVDDRVETEVGLANGLFHRADLPAVPDLHGNRLRVRGGDRGHLVQGHARAIDVHDHGIEEMHAGAPGAQARELLFQGIESPSHAAFKFLDVEFSGSHDTSLR